MDNINLKLYIFCDYYNLNLKTMDIDNFKKKDSLLYKQYKDNYIEKFNKIIEFGTAGFRS